MSQREDLIPEMGLLIHGTPLHSCVSFYLFPFWNLASRKCLCVTSSVHPIERNFNKDVETKQLTRYEVV